MRELSPFELFGLPERFALDMKALAERHQAALLKVHPDRFAGRPAAERRVAEQWSARINEAYALLKDPVQRAGWLCAAAGHPLNAETDTRMPADFLMAQIEQREALERARTPEDFAALKRAGGKEAADLEAGLADAIDQKRDWNAAVGLARRLMFTERFAREVERACAQAPHADAAASGGSSQH